MTWREDQIGQLLTRVYAEHSGHPDVIDAANSVQAAIGDDSLVPGPWGTGSCFAWSEGEAASSGGTRFPSWPEDVSGKHGTVGSY